MQKPSLETRSRLGRGPALVLLACMAALSGRADSRVRPADIVYALDQSGSMSISSIWISPVGWTSPGIIDTVYFSSTVGCAGYTNADLNGFGTVTIPSESGTRQVPRINPDKPPTGCRDFSGDPFGQRAITFRGAIDFQAALSPESRAGYLGFGLGLTGTSAPLKLDSMANVNAIKGNIKLLNSGGTNYLVALEQAKKWLNDPALSPNLAKAVVFLSDGRPTAPDSNSYLDVLAPNHAAAPGTMPPIYGIYTGNPGPDTAKLNLLADSTRGRFFLVPANRPDSLRAVMERILRIILDSDPSTGIRMGEKPPLLSPATACNGLSRHPDGSLLIDLGLQKAAASDILGRIRPLKRSPLSK